MSGLALAKVHVVELSGDIGEQNSIGYNGKVSEDREASYTHCGSSQISNQR